MKVTNKDEWASFSIWDTEMKFQWCRNWDSPVLCTRMSLRSIGPSPASPVMATVQFSQRRRRSMCFINNRATSLCRSWVNTKNDFSLERDCPIQTRSSKHNHPSIKPGLSRTALALPRGWAGLDLHTYEHDRSSSS